MKRLIRSAGGLKSDEAGAVAIMAALMMPVLAGIAAFSVDALFAYNQKERLRTTAEAAAAAGVTVLPDREAAQRAVLAFANENSKGDETGKVVSDSEIEIGFWDARTKTFAVTAEGTAANAIQVTASRTRKKGNPQPTFFGQVIGLSAFDAVAAAAVAVQAGGGPCINVLAPNGTGLQLNSNAKIDLKGCGIDVHSSDGAGFGVDSNAKVTVSDAEICVQGGTRIRNNSDVTPRPETNCSPAQDPFSDVPAPTAQGCEKVQPPVSTGMTVQLKPCIYSGGLTVNSNGKATLAPGEYVLIDGDLNIGSNAALEGDDVVIYLTGTAKINFNSNANVRLTARSSGSWRGFVLVQDRNQGGYHTINSNTSTVLNGTIYMPKGVLTLNSNTQIGMASGCMSIVAYQVVINANSGLNITRDPTCPGGGGAMRSRIVG